MVENNFTMIIVENMKGQKKKLIIRKLYKFIKKINC